MGGLQGRVVGGYQLTTPLGSGGICEVYRGTPTRPGGREVVVKVIPAEFARQPSSLARFRQVAQLAERLASHPHILPLLGSGEEAGSLYLISPYVADGTLKDWIARGGRVGTSDAGPFFHQLCDALAYAHSLGVIHGDVKPSNIYLFEGRHVLLGDFGLLLDVAHMDMTHAGPGTEAVAFLAPEVAAGKTSQASDIYGVGEVLFTAITGQPPFRARTPGEMFTAHARQPVPHVQQVAPGLSPAVLALDSVIQRAMAKRPQDRFPSAVAVAQAIEGAIHQAPQPAPGPAGLSAGLAQLPPSGFAPLGALGPLGAAAALGAPGGGFASPGFGGVPPSPFTPQSIGAAAPPAGLVAGAGLQALNFPPLSGEVDGDMDQGRIIVSPKAPPTAPALRGRGAVFAPEPPTIRVPAPIPGIPAGLPPTQVPFPGATAGPGMPPLPPAMVPPPAARPPDGIAGPALGFDGGGYGPQAMPAIRVPPPEPEERWQTGQQPALVPAGGAWPSLANDFSEAEGYTGSHSAALASVELERPFSPTELGLPRLTSPDLQELPPSWQELVRDAPRQQRGEYGGSYRAEQGERIEWAAEAPDAHIAGQGYLGPHSDGVSQWDDQQAWAGGAASAKGGRPRRRMGRIALVVVLLAALGLGALAVARPDLCPVSQCQGLSNRAHQYLPFLPQPSPTVQEVGGTPATITITVAPGKSNSATLNFKDVSSTAVTWSAATSPSWVSVSPKSGSLTPGGTVNLTVIADATSISAGTYPGTLTISSEGQVVLVPVSITVKSAS